MGVVNRAVGVKNGGEPLPPSQTSGRPDPEELAGSESNDEGRPELPEQMVSLGMSMFGVLKNQDPRRKYHFANKRGAYDVAAFRGLGFRVEKYEGEDGVSLMMDQDSYDLGAQIESGGQVLMSIDIEKWRLITAVAQKRADAVEAGYLSKEAGEVDVMRGKHGDQLTYRKSKAPGGFKLFQDMKTEVVTE
jgi:hypothetical protein